MVLVLKLLPADLRSYLGTSLHLRNWLGQHYGLLQPTLCPKTSAHSWPSFSSVHLICCHLWAQAPPDFGNFVEELRGVEGSVIMHHVVSCHPGGTSASFSVGSQSQGSPKGDLSHCVHSSVKGELILLFSQCAHPTDQSSLLDILEMCRIKFSFSFYSNI